VLTGKTDSTIKKHDENRKAFTSTTSILFSVFISLSAAEEESSSPSFEAMTKIAEERQNDTPGLLFTEVNPRSARETGTGCHAMTSF